MWCWNRFKMTTIRIFNRCPPNFLNIILRTFVYRKNPDPYPRFDSWSGVGSHTRPTRPDPYPMWWSQNDDPNLKGQHRPDGGRSAHPLLMEGRERNRRDRWRVRFEAVRSQAGSDPFTTPQIFRGGSTSWRMRIWIEPSDPASSRVEPEGKRTRSDPFKFHHHIFGGRRPSFRE